MKNWNLTSKIIVYSFIILFATAFTPFVYAENSNNSGDNKIGGMIDDIKRKEEEEKKKKQQEEKEQKEKEKEHKEHDKDDQNGCWNELFSQCIGSCFENIFPLLLLYASSIEYSDYPYSNDSDFAFSKFKKTPDEQGKIGYLKLIFEPTYLMDSTWGMNGRFEGALSILYANCIYQYNFSTGSPSDSWFSILSVNGGLTFPISNVAFTFFGGILRFFSEDPAASGLTYGSFGGNLQIFFPRNIVFEIYSLNAVSDYLWFIIVSPSISISLWRFSIGAGFNYYNYVGTEFMGPSIKLAFWL